MRRYFVDVLKNGRKTGEIVGIGNRLEIQMLIRMHRAGIYRIRQITYTREHRRHIAGVMFGRTVGFGDMRRC